MKINIFDTYTYTMESIIQAQRKGLSILSVPIRVNADLRPSRLIKNNFTYIFRSAKTMIRFFIIYHPFRFFISLASIFFILGFFLRFQIFILFPFGGRSGAYSIFNSLRIINYRRFSDSSSCNNI